ncbi:frequency clock protein, partial [Fusarium oxysporum]
QYVSQQQPLEPCRLSGVLPNNHFIIVINTKRRPNESIEGTINQRAVTLTLYPIPGGSETKVTEQSPSIEIKYLSGHITRLTPVPLPVPAIFFPPFSINNSTSGEYNELSIDVDNTGSSEEDISYR